MGRQISGYFSLMKYFGFILLTQSVSYLASITVGLLQAEGVQQDLINPDDAPDGHQGDVEAVEK